MDIEKMTRRAELLRLMEENPRILLCVKDAAFALGFSRRTMDGRAYKGLGPRRLKIGGKAVYRSSDLLQFIEESEVVAAA